jgi:hypothetical protein
MDVNTLALSTLVTRPGGLWAGAALGQLEARSRRFVLCRRA